MAVDYFEQKLALNDLTGTIFPGAVATIYAVTDTAFAIPLAITDITDAPLPNLVASPTGIYPAFKCPGHTQVIAKAGEVTTPITSRLGAVLNVVPDAATGEDGQVLTVVGDEWAIADATGGGGGGAGGDWAGLNTLGIGRAVFIPYGGSIPAGTPDYTLVIELPED
jgi:hypothetical protein